MQPKSPRLATLPAWRRLDVLLSVCKALIHHRPVNSAIGVMLPALRPTLSARLSAEFGSAAITGDPGSQIIATFQALHVAVGDAVVLQEGEEIIVAIEPHTHHHFECYADSMNPDERVQEIVDQVSSFLHELFADRVVFRDRSRHGSGNLPGEGRRGSAAGGLFGTRQLAWSGPVPPPHDA